MTVRIAFSQSFNKYKKMKSHFNYLYFFLFILLSLPLKIDAQDGNIEDYYDTALVYQKKGNFDSAFYYLNYAVDNFSNSWLIFSYRDFYPLYDSIRWKDFENKVIKKIKEKYTCENMELAIELLYIYQADQRWRANLDDYDESSDEYAEISRKMTETDSSNLERVEKIIAQYGYPSSKLVGLMAIDIPLLVIHHSNCEKISQYYRLFKKTVKKEPDLQQLFMLYEDRLLLCKGKKQKNGTQSVYNEKTGKVESAPIRKSTLRKNKKQF